MRLLLRADAHRPVDGGIEVAASPDTPRREAWQWHVRVVDDRTAVGGGGDGASNPSAHRQNGRAEGAPVGPKVVTVALPRSGSNSLLEIATDARAVAATAEVVIAGDPVTLDRDEREVVVMIVGQGRARIEGRHSLGELDALVLEGDDPLSVTVEREGEAPTSVGVVRLRSAGERAIGWVP